MYNFLSFLVPEQGNVNTFFGYIHTNFIQDVNKLIYRKNIISKDTFKRKFRG